MYVSLSKLADSNGVRVTLQPSSSRYGSMFVAFSEDEAKQLRAELGEVLAAIAAAKTVGEGVA